jgi:hypothetical protein
MGAVEYTLWGCHPRYSDGVWIGITLDNVRACRKEADYRESLGWECVVSKPGSGVPVDDSGPCCFGFVTSGGSVHEVDCRDFDGP